MKNVFFHDEQKVLLKILDSGKNLVVSAPTSFGKSLLIEEIIASGNYQNIVVIQPTLALLDETRKKITKYSDDYNIIVRTSQKESESKKNIFLLTAERVNEYQDFPHIDFLIVDEFYKFSAKRDDERSFSLNIAFYKLWNKFKPKFYLLGPNIQGITNNFEEKFNAVFYQTNYKMVHCVEKNILKRTGNSYQGREKQEKLFRLLLEKKDEQSLIYCSSPNRARKLAYDFFLFLQENTHNFSQQKLSIMEWIDIHIDPNWNLINCLKNKISFHDGILPKHISTSIIDYFNHGKVNFLFCTTTIIEGVNTSAKNIMYFDEKKGIKTFLDFFDYSNIKGRAGRLMHHYIGYIYHFNKPPPKTETFVDIPFFEQNPIQDEILIQLEPADVKNKKSDQYLRLLNIPDLDKKIIIKNGINIEGQLSILKILRQEMQQNSSLIIWNRIPSYEQLTFCLQLAWDYLLVKGETTRPMTRDSIIYHTSLFRSTKKIPLKNKIEQQYEYLKKKGENKKSDYEYKNAAILDVFRVQKHWIEYKIPKWLSIMHNLQEYISIEQGLNPGNYLYFSNLLENDYLPEEFMSLLEYGIPNSAIDKLQAILPPKAKETLSSKEIVEYIKKNHFYKNKNLLEYEKEKIKNALDINA